MIDRRRDISIDRLADHRSADSQLPAERWLAGQRLAWVNVTSHDTASQVLDDLTAQILSHRREFHWQILDMGKD